MVPASSELTPENEATYESLISLIENSQGRLAPIIVGCDDAGLRQRVIARYEQEAREAKIRPYRIVLGQEPSVRSGLAKLKASEPYLQRGGDAVFTVTGAEVLLRVKLRPEDEQSELDQFFGYLQWTREGLREFPYPIVLWVSHRILREMSRRAPDFWSWRKAVLRFADEGSQVVQVDWEPPARLAEVGAEDEPLPPPEEFLEEIQQLEQKSPESLNLATLYEKLGQLYENRIRQGKAKDLEQERELAIQSFKKSIELYTLHDQQSQLIRVWVGLGSFLDAQSRYSEAIDAYQNALNIAQKIGDRFGEAASLNNLGNTYDSLGQYEQVVKFHQQSLEIGREIGDRFGEAASLNNLGNTLVFLGQYERAINFCQQSLEVFREIGDHSGEANSLGILGNAYDSLNQHERAINFYQQSLEIFREIGNRSGEARSLGSLGNAYDSVGQYERAINFHQQSLEIFREIGDRSGEANSLNGLGNALSKYEPRCLEARQAYEQAKAIYAELKLDHMVEKCNAALHRLAQKPPD